MGVLFSHDQFFSFQLRVGCFMGKAKAGFRVLELQKSTDRSVQRTTEWSKMFSEDLARTFGASTHEEAKIAAELKCHPRTIERYMEGAREWSGEAVAVVVEELLRRHRLRNVKVRAR